MKKILISMLLSISNFGIAQDRHNPSADRMLDRKDRAENPENMKEKASKDANRSERNLPDAREKRPSRDPAMGKIPILPAGSSIKQWAKDLDEASKATEPKNPRSPIDKPKPSPKPKEFRDPIRNDRN